MIRFRNHTAYTAVLTLALASAIAGCSDDEDATGPGAINPAVLGNWDATSFDAGTGNLITQGMTFSLFFGSDGAYSFSVTNDLAGICDVGSTCSDFGDFTASATQIVLDPDTDDETFLSYSISGTTMTVNGDLDGTPATIELDNTAAPPAPDPAVVGTWRATSFVFMGNDLIPPLGVTFVFNADGTYSLAFNNDQGDMFCDIGEINCNEAGTYTATSTTITLDAGTTDEAILSYSISGSTMTINATIDGEDIVIVLDKA